MRGLQRGWDWRHITLLLLLDNSRLHTQRVFDSPSGDGSTECRTETLSKRGREDCPHSLLTHGRALHCLCTDLQGDFQGYCDRMEQRGVWGGEPELVVATNVVRR
jgi:hypothetical protein